MNKPFRSVQFETDLSLAEAAYVDPERFIPERWSTRPELIRNKNAFFPFSLGESLDM
jgi:hypothetical protein